MGNLKAADKSVKPLDFFQKSQEYSSSWFSYFMTLDGFYGFIVKYGWVW